MAVIELFFYYLLCAIGAAGIVIFLNGIRKNYHASSRRTNLVSALIGFSSFTVACWAMLTIIFLTPAVEGIINFYASFTARVYTVFIISTLVTLIISLMMNTIFSSFINKKISFSVAMIFNLVFLVGPPIYQELKRGYHSIIF